ncbi:hypothetical protein KIPB_006245 [Kipferlia bialata]|uniref:Uncharacterized protein n=1 Tax=Kipferlia bialata TaxID=797122 RepID=A0A9K3CY85_9EUKA|nr:hypothetical protein KIPB_005741 [Kipferlia bialata]GIQ84697.1 hypothetical protein KIPB_006245 [Kipferlia bialata]|eukprot:g5741.t1
MDEETKEAIARAVRKMFRGAVANNPGVVGDEAKERALDDVVTMMSGFIEAQGENEELEALLNPDPSEMMAKQVLAQKACLRAYPKVKAALEGVVEMHPPPTSAFSMRLWLCLPEGMERRGVSISYVSMLENGPGKGVGTKMVETALIGPDNQILYEYGVFGYFDCMEHYTLEDCIEHIKELRQYYVLMSQGETEAAEALSDAARQSVSDMMLAKGAFYNARREANRKPE